MIVRTGKAQGTRGLMIVIVPHGKLPALRRVIALRGKLHPVLWTMIARHGKQPVLQIEIVRRLKVQAVQQVVIAESGRKTVARLRRECKGLPETAVTGSSGSDSNFAGGPTLASDPGVCTWCARPRRNGRRK